MSSASRRAGFTRFDPATGTVARVSQLYDKDWNNFSPRVSAGVRPLRQRHDRRARGLGRLLRRLLAGLLRGPDPLGHVQPRRRLQRGRRVQLLAGGRCWCPGRPSSPTSARPTCSRWTPSCARPTSRTTTSTSSGSSAPHAAVQVGYVGSRDASSSATGPSTRLDPATGERPYPDFVYINQFESSASSSYNSLQASLRVRGLERPHLDRQLHTGPKSIDTASDGQDYVPHAAQPDNSLDPGRERADSNFDVRHRLRVVLHLGDRRARAGTGCARAGR